MAINKINELYYQSRKILKENRNDELTHEDAEETTKQDLADLNEKN